MLTTIASIFVFLIVILIHELGHFSVAKLVGIKVNEFAIGMGPKLYQQQKGETQYTLRLLPIGGYVKMEGEDESSNDPRSFNNVSVPARIAVVAAGAIMNFLLAIVVLTIVAYNIGVPTSVINKATPGSPAELAGIQSGDKIIWINDVEIENWEDIVTNINSSNPNEVINIGISRGNEEFSLDIMPVVEENRTIIGIEPKIEKSLLEGIKGGIQTTIMFLSLMFNFIGMLFKGQVSTNDLAGPIGVIREVGVAARLGMTNLLLLLGLLSINLGFFNLLPIPALDGSRILFLFLEGIRGKPIDPDKEGFIHLIGFVFLISLMILVTFKDIVGLGRW